MSIFFFVSPDKLHFFVDYITSIMVNYSEIKLITDYNLLIHIISDTNNKIIFVQGINYNMLEYNKDNNILLLNTEQLSKVEWVNTIHNYINKGIRIIDYSKANIDCLQQKKNVLYLPYIVNPNEIFNYEKIYDVAYIGEYGDIYRKNIIDKLTSNNITSNQIFGFDRNRDDNLFKHKILLNIHFNERFKIFEEIRCNRCIFNKMIVITEKSLNIEYELKQYIIECDYDNLVDTVAGVLNNYEFYYNKLFNNFDINKIHKDYLKLSDTVINDLL